MMRARLASLASLAARPWLGWILITALVMLVLAALLVPGWNWAARAAPPQPLNFSHQKHVDAGTECVFCHPGVINGAVAGLPSVEKCVGCHQNVQVREEKDQPDVDTLVRLWEEGRPMRWAKVNDQPDFVYFSHRPHVTNGLSCEACHGDVSHMDIARPVYNMNMGFCLDCHRKQAAEKVGRLVDCNTCHK